jgi:hypothetical protein
VAYLKDEYVALDPAVKADLDTLRAEAKGAEFTVTSRTDADGMVVTVDRVTCPSRPGSMTA